MSINQSSVKIQSPNTSAMYPIINDTVIYTKPTQQINTPVIIDMYLLVGNLAHLDFVSFALVCVWQ